MEKIIGNFVVRALTVEQGEHLMDMAGGDSKEESQKFTKALLDACVQYKNGDILVPRASAPFKEYLDCRQELMDAALDINGFRAAA